MRFRSLAPVLAIALLACEPEAAEETATTEEPQEYASEGDAASLVASIDDFETHYNMQHGSMVADMFSEEAMLWSGVSGMAFGRDAIAAQLQGTMDMASPEIDITTDDQMIGSGFGVARGSFTLEGSVDGQPVEHSGYWMSFSEMEEGEWQLHALLSNLDSEQATPGFTHAEMPAPLEDASLAADGADYFETHFNMGHAEMVANRYAEDAVMMASGEAMTTGRDAVLARLSELTEAGAQIEITTQAAAELGEDHVASIGTYTIEVGGETTMGHYGNVSRRAEDGTLLTVWSLTSAHPDAGM